MASRPTRLHINVKAGEFRRCETQKVAFETKADALTAAERLMDLGKVAPGCHIVPYECRECGQWHVANKIIVRLDRDPRRQLDSLKALEGQKEKR